VEIVAKGVDREEHHRGCRKPHAGADICVVWLIWCTSYVKEAEQNKDERFTALLHHITPLLLRKSYYQLKHDAAKGIDDRTWYEYYENHHNRIKELHDIVHKGSYRAQPVRRTYIPKEDGRQRPLGIASLEDKIVQQAVHTVLSQIYETDFANFSYGFREGRSQHDALDALYMGIIKRKINWILDADIQGYFDNIDHELLMKMIEKRIGDKRVLRLLRKWLKTGKDTTNRIRKIRQRQQEETRQR
jgi:group II intron reverse transcriptase/maturase